MSESISSEQLDISLHLYPHDSFSDASSFAGHASTATTIAPEIPTAHPRIEGDFNALRNSNPPAEDRLRKTLPGDFAQGMISTIKARLQNSKPRATVKILDVPHTDEWKQKMALIRELDYLALLPNLNDTLGYYVERFSLNGQLQEQRE